MRIRETTAFSLVALLLLYWNASSKMFAIGGQYIPMSVKDIIMRPLESVDIFLVALVIELVFSVSQLAFARKKDKSPTERWVYVGLVVLSAWLSFAGVGSVYIAYFGANALSPLAAFGLCLIIDSLAEQMLKNIIQ